MIVGRGELSLRRIDKIQDTRDLLSAAPKKLVFAHEASSGDTQIDLMSLNFPSSLTTSLLTNPSFESLLEANLRFYYRNMTLFSSARGVLIPDVAFECSNSNITFKGFTAFENEIFYGVIPFAVSPNTLYVDAKPINVSKSISGAETTFNVGEAYRVNEYPTQSSGAVKVFANGQLLYRNTNNSNVTLDRDYYEVPTQDGYGTVVEFNTPFGATTEITVISNYAFVDRPDFHLMQRFDVLAAQLESIAQQTGSTIDLTQFPNSLDLKAFGDRLVSAETSLNSLANIKYQIKEMTLNDTPASLDFNNLQNGLTYELTLVPFAQNVGNEGVFIDVIEPGGGVVFDDIGVDFIGATGTETRYKNGGLTKIFTAGASGTLAFSKTGSGIFLAGSYAILKELPNHVATTDWT